MIAAATAAVPSHLRPAFMNGVSVKQLICSWFKGGLLCEKEKPNRDCKGDHLQLEGRNAKAAIDGVSSQRLFSAQAAATPPTTTAQTSR
jgi:hypothetical protein